MKNSCNNHAVEIIFTNLDGKTKCPLCEANSTIEILLSEKKRLEAIVSRKNASERAKIDEIQGYDRYDR